MLTSLLRDTQLRPRTLFALGIGLLLLFAGCGTKDPLEQARALQEAGDFHASLEPLRDLVTAHSGGAEAQYLYGRALVRTGQWSLSEWTLREAMQDPEWRLPAGMLLTESALKTVNLPLAIEITSELLEQDPDNVDVLMMRANAYAHYRQDPEKALEDVARVQAIDPGHVDVMEPKILALLALERYDDARAALDELGELIEKAGLGPENQGWYCSTRAVFAKDSGNLEEAEQRFDDCVERFPTHPDVVSNAIGFFDEKGDFRRSLEIVRRAHEERPASREYRVVLAARLRLLGEADEAETLLVDAAEHEHPQLAPTAWIDVAKHYQEVEDYAASAQAAERAVAAAREVGLPLTQFLFEEADAFVMAGRWDEALAVAEELPVPAHQHMIRARVAQERGHYDEALEEFAKGFQLWPDNTYARYYAALAAEGAGDFDRALQEYRYAVRIDSAATDSRVRAARLLSAEGKLGEALGVLQIGTAPPRLDSLVLTVWILARSGNEKGMLQSLALVQQRAPGRLGEAVAEAARGVSERAGPAAALRMLRRFEKDGLSYREPALADALRAVVDLSFQTGSEEDAKRARGDVRVAVESHPEVAAFHEIQGLADERAGEREAARVAYRRALELAPEDVPALTGLGRLLLADEPEEALARFEQALKADPAAAAARRGAADALLSLGREEQARAQLEALLANHPFDAAAAARLAELRLEAGDAGDATLERAKRAARFGGGAEALELLGRVHRQRGEAELAERALAQAGRLRAAATGGAAGRKGASGDATGGKDSS